MKKIFLISIILIAACSKDSTVEEPNGNLENPTEEPSQISREIYFTYNSNPPTNPQEGLENWVVVHNSRGEILNYRKYEIGDDFSFESQTDSITPKISVTYITINKNSEVEDYQISTTTDLEKGFIQNINLNSPNTVTTPPLEGRFDLTIKNIPFEEGPSFNNVKISSEIGRLGLPTISRGYSNGLWDITFTDIPKYEGFEEYFISIVDKNNNLKFYPTYNTGVEDFEVDYQTQFILPDEEISFTLPPHESFTLDVAGFKEGQEFSEYLQGMVLSDVLSVMDNYISTDPLRVGYSNNFPKFRTRFSIKFSDYSYYIRKYGAPLEAIDIPKKPNFLVLDSSIQNFNYEVDLNFDSALHSWNYSENKSPNSRIFARWSIKNPKNNKSIVGLIPIKIQEEYPNLDLEKLEYNSTTFTFGLPVNIYDPIETISLPAN